MRNRPAFLTALQAPLLAVLLGSSALAQSPLTIIDWLGQPDKPQNLPETVLLEPPVTKSATQPEVQVTPLQALLPPIGLVSPAATGLPLDLWAGSTPEDIANLIRSVPVRDRPALQSLLFTLLLSETRPLRESGDAILLARLDRLIAQGATDPAQALVEQAGPSATPERFRRWFFTTLLSGDEDRACAALIAEPYLAEDLRFKVFCFARRGDWPTAALLLESAHALAEVFKRAPTLPKDHLMVVNLSGRGDKDMQTVMHHLDLSKQEKH